METIIKADEILCINCGSCIRACPAGLITKNEFPVPIPDSWSLCIDCGHCVAICPTGAMHQRSMGPEDCQPIDPHLLAGWDQASQFLTSRRSIRGYIKKQVEKEKIVQLLDVARYAPSGQNFQPVRWLVVNDPDEVQRLAGLVTDWMKGIEKANPQLYRSAKMEMILDPWELGIDRIARGAPCLIQGYAKKEDRTALPAITIAIAHVQLAATALGLGTCWAGYFNMASQTHPPLIEAMGLPEGQVPFGTFVIGYPAEQYKRVPRRKPSDITWR
jgi:nitroreductase/NAD-dependent dihydropyrimidine dehydrogenase PreA subunit